MRRGLLALALLLGGCAVPPAPPPPPVETVAAPAPRPRLWYVGLGMQGETWSENDVAETGTRLEQVATSFQVRPVVLSNRVAGQPEHFTAVDGPAVEQAMQSIADQAAPGDVVLVYVSTHGAPGLLGREAAGHPLPPVGIRQLQHWLAPLEGRDTILILSACFSGSFIPALKGDHRIIFTAARADRTSFGCQAGADHTVFGDALLQALRPGESLHQIVTATRTAVTRHEHEIGVTQPSLPQITVGDAVTRLYDAPVF